MSDWIPKSKISPPPWALDIPHENASSLSPVMFHSSDVDIVSSSQSAELSSVSSDVGWFTASEGMVLGIGMSLTFVTVVVVSVLVTKWYVFCKKADAFVFFLLIQRTYHPPKGSVGDGSCRPCAISRWRP